jgi:hypothetical protein
MRRAIAAAAALVVLGAAAPSAQADHVAPSVTATLVLLRFFARGAGVRRKASADRGMLNQLGALGTWVNPRRGGTLRIWATIGGHKTNTLRIRVLPKRC